MVEEVQRKQYSKKVSNAVRREEKRETREYTQAKQVDE